MSEKSASEEGGEGEGKEKKKKKLPLPLIIVGAAMFLAGGGASWYYMSNKTVDPAAAEAARIEKERKARVFLPIDQITVNLADEEDRFAQVTIIMEVANAKIGEDIKNMMPAVRNKMLLLVSARQAKDLMSPQGKELLAKEIAEETAKIIGKPLTNKPKKKPEPVEAKDEEAEGAEAKEGKEGKDAADKAKPKAPKHADDHGEPPAIAAIHFSHFIVQ
jgi:flagellar FliL protein